jgi:type II secretory pathway component PulF
MSSEPDPSRPKGGPLSAEDLIALNEEIAGMARAGLPLDQGLHVLAREIGRGRLQQVTGQLADDLRAGFTLPQALQRQEGHVPPYYAALLAAGIRSGRMGEVLATLTLYARSLADVRDTVGSALVYPAIIVVLGFTLLLGVGGVILPAYVDIFQKMKLRLPPLTQALVFIGEHPLTLLVLPVVCAVAGLVILRKVLRSSAGGRVLWARLVYALPLAGTLLRSARLAAFTDLMGILVDQSVPLPEALRLAAEASSDPLLTEGSKQIQHEVGQGVPLGNVLKQQRLVPDLVVWMIGFGEKQGTLGQTLHQVAQMYRRQAEVRAGLLRTILPSLMLLVLAGILAVLFIFGLMQPLFRLLDGLSGGKL